METSYESWLADVVRRGYVVETCQVEPFTYVKMKYVVNGIGEFIGHGFAKKSPDDYWSPSSGVDIARIRAVGHIVGQLLERRGDIWLDSANKAHKRAKKAESDLMVAEKKIADMMDIIKEAVDNARGKVESHHVIPSNCVNWDEDMPKPKRFVTTGGSELILLSAPNEALTQKLLNLAGRFGDSAKGTSNTSVRLFLNPCYDKQEVLDWLRGQIHRESLSMRIKAKAAEFESKPTEAQAKMDEAECTSKQEKPEQVSWLTGTDKWTFIGNMS